MKHNSVVPPLCKPRPLAVGEGSEKPLAASRLLPLPVGEGSDVLGWFYVFFIFLYFFIYIFK